MKSKRWYACYTRARHEKKVDEHLHLRGFETYLPLIERERQWKDRKKRVEFPLFPSYVFVRFSKADVHQVLQTPGVSTIVRLNGELAAIPDEELEDVRRLVAGVHETGDEPEPVPYFEEGQPVRVMDGPFKGMRGQVVERRGRRRVLVGLSAIRQGLEVDIGAENLEPVKN